GCRSRRSDRTSAGIGSSDPRRSCGPWRRIPVPPDPPIRPAPLRLAALPLPLEQDQKVPANRAASHPLFSSCCLLLIFHRNRTPQQKLRNRHFRSSLGLPQRQIHRRTLGCFQASRAELPGHTKRDRLHWMVEIVSNCTSRGCPGPPPLANV